MAKRVAKDKAIKDKIWSDAVKSRDNQFCQVCNRAIELVRLNAHHLIPREFIQWRWSVDNGMTLCVHCHTLGKCSAHKNPIWFFLWLHKNKPDTFHLSISRLRFSNNEGSIAEV